MPSIPSGIGYACDPGAENVTAMRAAAASRSEHVSCEDLHAPDDAVSFQGVFGAMRIVTRLPRRTRMV
jgi:hypothetical protein